MKVEKELLLQPVSKGVRVVALGFIEDAEAASVKLEAEPNADALHEFRVALRRLRSWLRAFRGELRGTIRKKDRRRLRDIAAATGLGRDIDVQLAWVRKVARGKSRRAQTGARWMEKHLVTRQRQAGDAVDAALMERFHDVRADLVARLSVGVPSRRSRRNENLAGAIARHLKEHAVALGAALDQVHSAADEVQAHEARIAAKRVRYLMEPAAPFVKGGRDLLRTLKNLQSKLGDLHDAHVMASELRTVLESSAVAVAASRLSASHGATATTSTAPAGDAMDGLLALADRVERDANRAFKAVSKTWLDGRHRSFRRSAAGFAGRLGRLRARR